MEALPFHLLSVPPRLVKYPSISTEQVQNRCVCQICYEDTCAMYILLGKNHTCGHVMCGACMASYLQKFGEVFHCPTCRATIHRKNIRRIWF